VTGLVPSVSMDMLSVEILLEETLDKTYCRAAFSPISHSFSNCLGVNLGMPISSKKFFT